MKCPQCGNKIKLVSGLARPKAGDYHYTCSSCGTCLKWSPSGTMGTHVKIFIAVIVLVLVSDFLFLPGTIFGYLVILLSVVILFVVLLRNRFRLERCDGEDSIR